MIKIIQLDFVNAFLVKVKDGFVLIDTGMPQHWERLEAQLIAAGCFPSQLKLVIITHGDQDHLGNCAKLQEKYKAKIAMHEADAFMAEGGVLPKRKARTLAGRILMLLFRLRRQKIGLQKFKPDIFLKDGETVVLGGLLKDTIKEGLQKVPYLSQIPFFGALFRARTLSNDKAELLVFITPRIVAVNSKDQEDNNY